MNRAVRSFVVAAIEAAAEVYEIPTEVITGDRGDADESWARQVAMYVALEIGEVTSGQAAEYFHRDPSTLRFARGLVAQRVKTYPNDNEKVSRVSRLALDRASKADVSPQVVRMTDDTAFIAHLTVLLTDPKYANEAAELRIGRRCITYSHLGALALHPFQGKP